MKLHIKFYISFVLVLSGHTGSSLLFYPHFNIKYVFLATFAAKEFYYRIGERKKMRKFKKKSLFICLSSVCIKLQLVRSSYRVGVIVSHSIF